MSTGISTLNQRFVWDEQRTQVAISLASGATKQEAADEAGVDRGTVYNWLKFAEFGEEVDRLSLMVGIASRAERLRQAKRVLKSKMKDGVLQSDKDALEWLKFAQSETDGVKLDLGKLAASFAQNEASVASGGPSTGDSEGAPTTATNLVS
jgi:hypothetical protein